jgi:thiamine-phosphate pyrophosphorylase
MSLPRLLAYLDDSIAARDDLGVGLAAVAAAGPDVAIVVRSPTATASQLSDLAHRAVTNARPPGARVLVTGRFDIALASGAEGVILRSCDLPANQVPGTLIRLASVHSVHEARAALAAGAQGLIVGNIWHTPSHPGRPGAGIELLRAVVELGVPVYAIGGIDAERARLAVKAGAWGAAAIRAIWAPGRQYRATVELLEAIRDATRFQDGAGEVEGAVIRP